MIDYLTYLIKNLVSNPDQVLVTELTGESMTIYEVRCAKSDIGQLVGRQGRTIGAIRTLLYATASKRKIRAEISIVE